MNLSPGSAFTQSTKPRAASTAESPWSAVFQAYVCRAEDDLAADAYGGDAESLVADYALAGWREVRRVGLGLCPPKKAS